MRLGVGEGREGGRQTSEVRKGFSQSPVTGTEAAAKVKPTAGLGGSDSKR